MSAATQTLQDGRGDSADSQPNSWPALRRQPTPGENQLCRYTVESWWTAEGARLKAARLQRMGLPDMTNWRFVTLTVATRSISPEAAYVLGKARLRRFLARFRKAIGRTFKWCWKLEFHEDGYAHWHLLLEYCRRIPEDMLLAIEQWWGLGRINVKRVKAREMAYVFKYVAKGIEDLPAWVMRHRGRLRVFQSSKGFFVGSKVRATKMQEPRSCLLPLTLGEKLEWDARKALLVETTYQGERWVSVVKLRIRFSELYMARIREAVAKRQCTVGFGTVPITAVQTLELKHEHRKWSGLGRIPDAAAA